MALAHFWARIRSACLPIRAWFRGWTRSDILAVIALLGSAAAFSQNVLIRVDDLKFMVPNWPMISGSRQQVTLTNPQFMAFLNMGNRPIAVTGMGFFVEWTDAAGEHSADLKQFQIQPFIVDAGKILTKELSPADGTVTFNPAEIFKLSDKNQTIILKLRARFSIVTPDGSISSSIDLHSELPAAVKRRHRYTSC